MNVLGRNLVPGSFDPFLQKLPMRIESFCEVLALCEVLHLTQVVLQVDELLAVGARIVNAVLTTQYIV